MGVFRLQRLYYVQESSFGANSDAYSAGGTVNLAGYTAVRAVGDTVTLNLAQTEVARTELVDRLASRSASILTTKDGSTLEFSCYLSGLGTAAGNGVAATQTGLGALLIAAGFAQTLGTGDAAEAGSTSTVINLTAHGFAVGAGVVVGARGDGRGDGEFRVITATTANSITLNMALKAAPNTGDVVYAMATYVPQDTTALNSYEFVLNGLDTSGDIWALLGCKCETITFANLNPGEVPTATFRWRVATWVRMGSVTNAPAVSGFQDPVGIAHGGLYVQNVGTSTRAVVHESAFTFDPGMAAQPVPSSAGPAQSAVINWVRTAIVPTGSFSTPFAASYLTDHDARTGQFIMRQNHHVAGRVTALECQRAYWEGGPPLRENINDQTYTTVRWRGDEGTTTTNNLTRAAFRVHLG